MSPFEIIVLNFIAIVIGVALGSVIHLTDSTLLGEDVMVLAKKIWRKLGGKF